MKDLIKLIIDNVRGSILTTILGCITFVAGLVALFFTETETYICVEIMVLGLVVACLKDPKNNKKGGSAAALSVLIFFLITSCATERRCANKFGASSLTDSVRIETKTIIKDTTITIPSDTVMVFIENPCDSIGNLKPGIVRSSSKNKTVATAIITPKGIEIECLCEEEKLVITRLREIIDYQKTQKTEIVKVQPLTFKQKYLYPLGLLLVGIVVGIIINKLSKIL